MMNIIDITHTFSEDFPVWPNSSRFRLTNKCNFNDSDCFSSDISMNLHVGSHMDAPLHFIKNANDICNISLENLIGEVLLIEIKDTELITSKTLLPYLKESKAKRLIIKTNNTLDFKAGENFNKNFTAISSCASELLYNYGFIFVGIDGPSIQRFNDSNNLVHEILLKNNITVVEGLNLKEVSEGYYDLICLPIKIGNAEASPVRAILLPRGSIKSLC